MQIVLRDKNDNGDYQYLGVELSKEGDLIFTGQDLGRFVKKHYGSIEYEWTWTIKSDDMLLVSQALGTKDNVLSAIKSKFNDNDSYKLIDFLNKHKIPYEEWHRIGD